MNKQQFFTLLLIFTIVCAIAFMIFMVFHLKSQGFSCMADPISYMGNKTNTICSCWSLN